MPTALDLLDEDGQLRHIVGSVGEFAVVDGGTVDETVAVDMDETVTAAVSLLLGEMDPDVRLNITLPACTWNGAVLPRVLLMHALDDELPGPQQKEKSSWNG